MTTASDIKTNAQGFVTFSARNFKYAGDKGSWARVRTTEEGTYVDVQRAGKGIMSSDFTAELTGFCAELGIDLPGCGQRVSKKIC